MAISNDSQQSSNKPPGNGLLSENGGEEAEKTRSENQSDDPKLTMDSPSHDFGPNFIMLPTNNQIKELQTILRDKETTRGDFVFTADRLIRLLIESGLNQLPSEKCDVVTPLNKVYNGVRYVKGNVGVSVIRSGESMEKGLRDCCRSIRIGKILVQSDEVTHEARVLYAKFPVDIEKRRVLLLYPILSTGNTIIKAVEILKEHRVKEENIILLNLFCTPTAISSIVKTYPSMKIVSSEIDSVAPLHFGQKYFGTD